MSHLRPCSGCARHVRANATACPFCNAALEMETTAPALAPERLGRAARMAFGGAAAVAMTVAGCGKDAKENIAMPYGAPPMRLDPDAANAVDPLTATADAAAPAVDAATPADAATAAADAGKKVTPKATATATASVPRGGPTNMNKPYGAPPADGYDVFDV